MKRATIKNSEKIIQKIHILIFELACRNLLHSDHASSSRNFDEVSETIKLYCLNKSCRKMEKRTLSKIVFVNLSKLEKNIIFFEYIVLHMLKKKTKNSKVRLILKRHKILQWIFPVDSTKFFCAQYKAKVNSKSD